MEDKQTISEGEIENKGTEEKETKEGQPALNAELSELNEKYIRLYADFENYKKRMQKDREELIKYSNEALLFELLTIFDNLEMALKHSADNISEGIVQGVGITLRELQRITEKFGLTPISALEKLFDPSLHHAISQVEMDDVDDKTVVEEFRRGYMLGDKVLRPSLVAVSKKTSKGLKENETEQDINIKAESKEE